MIILGFVVAAIAFIVWCALFFNTLYHLLIGTSFEKVRWLRWIYLVSIPVGVTYATVANLGELQGIYLGICAALAVSSVGFSFALFNSRGSQWQKAYELCDKYRKEGGNPVIIADSIFGPYVEKDRPWNLRTSPLMWTDKGGLHFYETATRSRYEYASRVFGNGPY